MQKIDGKHIAYRPDIDGLRAVAILSVLLFHAFPSVLPGGFTGVDIFLVISGYLISSILLSDIERDQFSLLNFYSRRIRRIFPALIVVLICVLLAGYLLLFQQEFHLLTRHVAASAVFYENFVLWKESGYFDAASQTKPLLHLWSLAIEEQFYICWPVFLYLGGRREMRSLALILAVAVVSFSYGLYLSYHDSAAAYYSPFGRFWELMVGSALVYVVRHKPDWARRYSNPLALAGLGVIAIGMAVINQQNHFPGWRALLPTIGAALVISAGPLAWINRYILASRPFVWCGLISYPLYLWHWPVLVYSLLVVPQLGNEGRMVVLVASFVLAALTYRLVEHVFRSKPDQLIWRLNTQTWLAAAMASLCVVAVAAHGLNPNTRLKSVAQTASEWDYLMTKGTIRSPDMVGIYRLHPERRASTLFIGDSHLAHYAVRIDYAQQHDAAANAALLYLGGACIPIDKVRSDDLAFAECWNERSSAFDMVNDRAIDTVVIGGCWNWYFFDETFYYDNNGVHEPLTSETGRRLALSMLEAEIKNALALGKQTFLVLDNPMNDNFRPGLSVDRLSGRARNPDELVPEAPEQLELRAELLALARRVGVHVIDPLDTVCEQGGCRWATKTGIPIYNDDNHFNAHWAVQNAGFIDATVQPAAMAHF
jgi:peptidoglycan/LPS O-acetylase OafA/YrhL